MANGVREFKKCYFASDVLFEWLLKVFFSKCDKFRSEEVLNPF